MSDTTTEKQGIPAGSGYIYETAFSGTIPEDNVIETDVNRLGYIEKGATLTYKATFKKFKDDMGRVARNLLTDEDATFKFGLVSWVYSKLNKLCSTCRVTEKDGGRTIKIGGIGNDDGLKHLFRFVHPDKLLGDVRITIVGTNTGGLSLKYAPDDSSNIEPEISAEPSDDEGTLVLLDIKDPLTSLGALTVTSAAGTNTGTTKITVSPVLTSGDSYMYKTASSVSLPLLGDICNTAAGYTAWDGTADITATTGNNIVIVEVDSSFKAIKAGKATVTAKA
jgi:hypothetical protein